MVFFFNRYVEKHGMSGAVYPAGEKLRDLGTVVVDKPSEMGNAKGNGNVQGNIIISYLCLNWKRLITKRVFLNLLLAVVYACRLMWLDRTCMQTTKVAANFLT